ncbi:Maf family protein [Bacillus sp. FSL K6-6483]
MNTFLLASSSPRRSEFLKQCHYQFFTQPSNVEETFDPTWENDTIVKELARRKAASVAANHPNAVVLGADTIVVHNGKHLGKPANVAEAKTMLMALSNSTHTVYTGVAILHGNKEHVFSDAAKVTFDELTPERLERYLQSGDSLDKAGAYGIQSFGAIFVSRIEGDFYTVAGLPLLKTAKALEKFHIYPNIG